MSEQLRVLAKFTPQRWCNDYAISLDEDAYTFDVTDLVREMPLNRLIGIEDDSEAADDLWYQYPASWDGPFRVEVRAAIDEYLAARVAAEVQETPEAAAMIVTLLTDWSGTFDALVTTARELVANEHRCSPSSKSYARAAHGSASGPGTTVRALPQWPAR